MRVSMERFEEAVHAAIHAVPAEFQPYLEDSRQSSAVLSTRPPGANAPEIWRERERHFEAERRPA
jgi:hypothetical protein